MAAVDGRAAAVVYEMARCYDRLERLDGALTQYQRYLVEAPTASDAEAVRGRIRTLEQRRAARPDEPPAATAAPAVKRLIVGLR